MRLCWLAFVCFSSNLQGSICGMLTKEFLYHPDMSGHTVAMSGTTLGTSSHRFMVFNKFYMCLVESRHKVIMINSYMMLVRLDLKLVSEPAHWFSNAFLAILEGVNFPQNTRAQLSVTLFPPSLTRSLAP